MPWRYFGKATADATNPQGAAECDRCGFWYNNVNLQFQYDVQGTGLVNTNLRVCGKCLDEPFWPRKALRLPPDPEPLRDPRPSKANTEMNNAYPIYVWDSANSRWDTPGATWDFS